MRGINRVFLFGLVGSDPEPRRTPNGKTVVQLSVATNHGKRVGDQWQDEVTWHKITLWEANAEQAIRFARKGQPVAVEGTLRNESWTDKEGKRRARTFVLGHRIHLTPQTIQAAYKRDTPALPQPVAEAPVLPEPAPF